MNEQILSRIWSKQLFERKNLRSQQGEYLQIIHPGFLNKHAGADFQEAHILLSDFAWIGSVELHVRSSDWLLHAHHQDSSFENVILHVVWIADLPIYYQDGREIPTLELCHRVQNTNIMASLEPQANSIACQPFFQEIPHEIKTRMLTLCTEQRMQIKYEAIIDLWNKNNQDWDETFYQSLGKSFGFGLNAEPMLRLTQAIPLKLILRNRDRQLGIEAAMMGLAGMLEEPIKDEYQWELRREFIHLKKKHQWENAFLQMSDWKFLRLRPANFPTIRMAQFSEVIRNNCSLLSILLEIQELKVIQTLFEISPSTYWQTHYHFGKKSKKPHKQLGRSTFYSLCINTLIPILLAYAHCKKESKYTDKAYRWLFEMEAENNVISRIYTQLGLEIKNAHDSQACLHWHKNYCQIKKCLSCSIGQHILL
ncbi:DUF2851 family protein [Aquirufa aurantiipilula]|uniref:DUF2851 family protein n=1 Tax=Aquirufa aurantiipilula TaxID=2696561 RepID=A0ABT6BG45_9BACT|nr:DUF2851 family protein [Aquirufa aurantiipilula]MDF5689364.1 DUF2851 family protein [Aquirufa aurantiipilula]